MTEIVTQRRITHRTTGDSTGLGMALAIALAIIALLALFALSRGAFNPAPSQTSPNSTQNQAQPGMNNQSPAPSGGVTY